MKKQFTNKARYLGLKLTAIVFALLLITSGQSWGQTVFTDDFTGTVGTALTANGWTLHSGSGSPYLISTPGLTYTSYIGTGIGNAASTAGTGDDVNKAFTSTNSGSLYMSFMYKPTSASLTTDYSVMFGATSGGSVTGFFGKLYVQRDASNNVRFGITKTASGSIAYTGYTYSLNTTYLIVIRYDIVSGTTNDVAYLFVNPVLGGTEPSPTATGNTDASADPAQLTSVCLRQATNSAGAVYDGFRIGRTWADVSPPVAPTTQAHDITFSSVTSSGMKIDWTNGNGASRAVFVKETSGTITDPVDGTTYTPSTDWTSKGTQLASSGYYCVYNGTGTTVTLTNLEASTAYYVQVYEYNGSGATSKYYTATATLNPNNQTTSAASSPTITLDGTINAFANTVINTTSTYQSYTVQGANLTDNIIVTPPAGFQISKSSGSGYVSNPNTLSFTPSEVVSAQPIYVIFAPTAVQAYSGNITHTSTGATQMDKAVSGTGIKAEPTNHATGFDAVTGTPTYSAVIISWTDATGTIVPDGYLIKGSSVGYGSITDPSDGTAEADGSLVKNIAQGTEIYEFTGLSASTPYYFKIYPYTNSGTSINYKTDGTIPQATATTDAQPVLTYTWNVASGNWNTAASWTPVRTFPATSDVLIFDGTTQASPTVTLDFTSPQSVGRLRIINNANVTFGTSATTRILNIGYTGVTSPQLEITSGATLTVSAASAVTINVTTGFTGSISGNITFQNAAHRLTAADASGITFNSGSIFTAGTNFSGNAFNATPYNTIVFANGSTYIHEAGSNPFGATQPNSVVVFQSGSLYKLKATGLPAVNGRIFANFEIDAAGFSNNLTGSVGFTMDNLILTNCTSVGMNLTGAMNIKGNISINSGTLSFSPASATNVNLNGTLTQTISGAGTLTIASTASFVVDNTVIADRNITFGGTLTVNSGKSLTVNAGKQLTVTGTTTLNSTECLVLKSDATGTASFTDNGTISGSGTAKAERYLTGNVFHQLGLPISNTVAAGTGAGQTGDVFKYCTLDSYNEATNTYTALTASSDVTTDKGYVVKYTYGAGAPAFRTLSFAGTLNTGTVNIPMTNNAAGYNLIPNPYPSSIDWNAASGWTKNVDANNTIYVWDAANLQFTSYDGSAGINGGVRYIAPGQAFFIKAATAGNITMDNNVRVHNATAYLKSTNTIADNMIKIKVSGNANSISDEAVVYFSNSPVSQGSEKWFSYEATAPSLYTVKSNTNYCINVLSDANTTVAVPLAFKAGANGNYILNAIEIGNFSLCSSVTLEDTKTGNTQNLLNNQIYNFTSTTIDNVNRFILHFAASPNAIDEISNNNTGIYAYDNNIYINGSEKVKQINIYNTLGQLVKSVNNVNGLQKINMNGNATGYYIVRVVTENKVYSEKVMVK